MHNESSNGVSSSCTTRACILRTGLQISFCSTHAKWRTVRSGTVGIVKLSNAHDGLYTV